MTSTLRRVVSAPHGKPVSPKTRRSRGIAVLVIEAFGGPTKTARAIKSPITTVDSWRRNGIPPWRWDSLRRAAKRQRVRLPPEIARAA